MAVKTLTKQQLIAKLADDAKLDKKAAAAFMDALTVHITCTMKKGGVVKLQDLGKFALVKRKARMGRNPQTGQAIKIPAKTVAKFYLAKGLRDIAKK